MKKYEFTGETKKYLGITLRRIRRLSDGLIGGWIESEDNLSQKGTCFVYKNARVYGNARVYSNAQVYGNAQVFDKARVYGGAYVYGNARVYCNAQVYGNVWVYGDVRVSGNARVYGNAWVYGTAQVFGKDNLTGAASTLTNVCEFHITYSVKDKYIRVGCESHSFSRWSEYIKSKSKAYLGECRDTNSHKACVQVIKMILKITKLQEI